jgi:hypothetical protein
MLASGSFQMRRVLLMLLAVIAALVLWLLGPIAQDPDYHHFVDERQLFGVPNFGNVISNLPFVLVAALGLLRLPRLSEAETRIGYALLCIGVLLVGFGSAWYHYAPSNQSLVWDRLPMTVAFMALLGLLLRERVVAVSVPALQLALVSIGMLSVMYWNWTESAGRGDLRPYMLVQFLPVIFLPLILWLFPARYLDGRWLLATLALYVVAKLLELADGVIWSTTGGISGHSLKHVAAAAAVACLIMAVPTRPDPAARRVN